MPIMPFYYLMKLHYSQTLYPSMEREFWFYYLMKLHYSQTRDAETGLADCFTTL